MNEIWEDIEGYEGLYRVSNLGRVKSLKRNTAKERIMCNRKDKYGYLYVGLCKNGNIKYHKIHRLVAKAFIPNPNNLPQVNHIDGKKENNTVKNLEWCDASYNQIHAVKLGLVHNWMKGKKGKNCIFSIKVCQYTADGRLIKIWDSMSDVTRELGIPVSNISRACNNPNRKAHGFKWSQYKLMREGD